VNAFGDSLLDGGGVDFLQLAFDVLDGGGRVVGVLHERPLRLWARRAAARHHLIEERLGRFAR